MDGYRYGYGGQERDNEINSSGNSYTAEYWQYDSRLGRRWNIDPITFADLSPFSCFNNNPIYYNDPLGLSPSGPDNPKGNNFITRGARALRSNLKMAWNKIVNGDRDPRGVIKITSNGQEGRYEAGRWGEKPEPGERQPNNQTRIVVPDIEPKSDPTSNPTQVLEPLSEPPLDPIKDPIIPPLPCVPQQFGLNFNWVRNNAIPQVNAFARNQLQIIANQWNACNTYTQVRITVNTPLPVGTQFQPNGATGVVNNTLMFNRAQWIQRQLVGMGIPSGAFVNGAGQRRLSINWGIPVGAAPSSTVNIR